MTATFRTALFATIFFCCLVLVFPRAPQAEGVPEAPPDPALFATLEKFHGHTCAGSLFGARLGIAARNSVRAAGGTGKLRAVYYDHSCPVDGVQVGAGTTYGNKALTVDDRNDHRLALSAEGNGKRVETRLTARAEEKGLRSRELGKKARALPEGSAERKIMEREIADIFDWFRTAPTADVVTTSMGG